METQRWRLASPVSPPLRPAAIAIVGPIGCGLFRAALHNHWHYTILARVEAFIAFAAVACVPPRTNHIIEVWKSYPPEVSTALSVSRISFAIAVEFLYEGWVEKVGVQWVWVTAVFVELFAFSLIVMILMSERPSLRRFSLWPDSVGQEPAMHEDS